MDNNTDIKLEWSVVASLLAQPDGTVPARVCADILSAEDFTNPDARTAWETIAALVKEKQDVNIMNAFTKAREAGRSLDVAKLNAVGYDGNTPLMASVIHELGMRRRLTAKLRGISERLGDDDYSAADAAASLAEAVTEVNRNARRQLTPWAVLFKNILTDIERKANGLLPQGVPTGFALMDDEGGLVEGDLTIIAGRTSNGKTAFALNVALNVARAGVPVVVLSLEMTNNQLGARLLANLSGVDQRSIKAANLSDEQWQRLIGVNSTLPLYFSDDRDNGREPIFLAIRRAVDKQGARVVFIDYLQLIKGAGKDRRLDVASIANDLKVLAVQLNVTIILLSQLAREERGSQPVPKLNQLKESGEIENAADAVYFVYRPEQHSPTLCYPDLSCEWSRYSTRGTALLMCAKNRNGRTGEQLLGFNADTSRFYEADSFPATEHTSQNFNAF